MDTAIQKTAVLGKQIISGQVNYISNPDNFDFHKNLFPIPSDIQDLSDDELHDHIRQRTLQIASKIFFSKTFEWTNENEFRWVLLDDDLGGGPIDFHIGNSLAGIILGCDFDNKYHDEAAKLAEDNGIPVSRLWWRNGLASSPWPLSAFAGSEILAKWSDEAKLRREGRYR